MYTVDALFDNDALLTISYSTFLKGMCHTTGSACPKWAICGVGLRVIKGAGSREFQESF
jgi:hypothetical protein